MLNMPIHFVIFKFYVRGYWDWGLIWYELNTNFQKKYGVKWKTKLFSQHFGICIEIIPLLWLTVSIILEELHCAFVTSCCAAVKSWLFLESFRSLENAGSFLYNFMTKVLGPDCCICFSLSGHQENMKKLTGAKRKDSNRQIPIKKRFHHM